MVEVQLTTERPIAEEIDVVSCVPPRNTVRVWPAGLEPQEPQNAINL